MKDTTNHGQAMCRWFAHPLGSYKATYSLNSLSRLETWHRGPNLGLIHPESNWNNVQNAINALRNQSDLNPFDGGSDHPPSHFKTFVTFLSQSWLMLKRLCFKPFTNKILSIREDVSLPMLSWPMILHFALSPKVTYPLFLFVGKTNLDSSPIMCLEHPLSKNHLFFFEPYKIKFKLI